MMHFREIGQFFVCVWCRFIAIFTRTKRGWYPCDQNTNVKHPEKKGGN